MMNFGRLLADASQGHGTVYLLGNLGAGKTTICRGVLRGFGYDGAVKSPTYTLVEPYELAQGTIYHFDLYRLGDPEELDFLGVRDYFDSPSLCLIEWPDRGKDSLPIADIILSIEYLSDARVITIKSQTKHGQDICKIIAGKQGELKEDIC
ncbi:MAG: tRNA (adenosine(37)-N6)-threonylcarbamoyltransferase complex ATPase subunit type 1 TsaE [Endozoicomonadaceae bacterium]|nr:tRNA (adenosine(37)-N6)-threonylcarbamoyltransferase complex ATPase subunit type 1 TsaE [Endozoicomonadaceae bacterium]